MSFHCIYCQAGVATIKVKRLPDKFQLRIKLAPGKSERQEHIYDDIRCSSTPEKSGEY
jgi:hypothetical protein